MTLNMGNTNDLVAVLRRYLGAPQYGVEVGVHRGETSAKLLRAFPGLHLWMVDPWTTYPPEHPYRQSGDGCSRQTLAEQEDNMRAAAAAVAFARDRCTIVRATSLEAGEQFRGPKMQGPPLCFAFLDDDHTLAGVRTSLRTWSPIVRPGGLVAVHDLDHPRDRRGVWGVRCAFTEFCERDGLRMRVRGELGYALKLELELEL